MPVKIEVDSFPLRIERFGSQGWFFVTCDAISGLMIFGPELDALLDQIRIAAKELLEKRDTTQ